MSIGTSEIGDYIHYHINNYIMYGIAHANGWGCHEDGAASAENAIQRAHKQAQKLYTTKLDKDEYAKILTKLFRDENAEYDAGKINEQMRNLLDKLLSEEFSGITKRVMNYATGDIEQGAAIKGAEATRGLQDLHSKQYISYEAIDKRISALIMARDQLTELGDYARAETLTTYITQITQQVDDLVQAFQAESIRKFGKIMIPLDKNRMNLRDIINTALHVARQGFPVALAKGRAFEYAGAIAGYLIKYNAWTGAENAIKDYVTINKNQTQLQLSTHNKQLKKFLDTEMAKAQKIQLGDLYISEKPSYQKVDVSFLLEDENINISMKNYNFKSKYKNISLVSGTPLLYLLQDETNLLNHLLNILVTNGWYRSSIPNRNQIFLGAKIACLLTAFAGSHFGKENREQANLFIVNDNSKGGQIYIFDMKDIFEKACASLNDVVFEANGQPLELLNFYNANHWESSASRRVANVIMAAHATKMHIAINNSIVTK